MEVFLKSVLILSLTYVLYLYTILRLRQHRILRALNKQGIDGPRPRFLSGNLAEMKRATLAAKKVVNEGERGYESKVYQDYAKTLFPYLHQWRKTYGTHYK